MKPYLAPIFFSNKLFYVVLNARVRRYVKSEVSAPKIKEKVDCSLLLTEAHNCSNYEGEIKIHPASLRDEEGEVRPLKMSPLARAEYCSFLF